MKKIILILGIFLAGCSSDDAYTEPCRDCLVVTLIQDYHDHYTLSDNTVYVEMINECTGEERFSLPYVGTQTLGECYNTDD